jgi:hypothetical protein
VKAKGKSVDEYLAHLSDEQRAALEKLRSAIPVSTTRGSPFGVTSHTCLCAGSVT